MESDAIWQAFAQTGDPLYYLLHRELERGSAAGLNETGNGEEPRPAD